MKSEDQERAAASTLLQLVTSNWMTQALVAAAQLGLPDLLAEGPRQVEALAESTGAHGPSLHRLLRALSTIDVVRECQDGAFELTSIGEVLRPNARMSLHHYTLHLGRDLWRVMGRLPESIKSGRGVLTYAAAERVAEEVTRERSEMERTFNRAMIELTRLDAPEIARSYDFSTLATVMDVGGGHGELLGAVLSRYHRMRGILFDRPQVVIGARDHLGRLGVAERCEFVAGDFFESVPSGADAYLLKGVIGDWNNDRAIAILRTCRQAMPDGSRLLLIDNRSPDRLDQTPDDREVAGLDLHILVALGGGRRTLAELRGLLENSGYRVGLVQPVGSRLVLLEGLPAR